MRRPCGFLLTIVLVLVLIGTAHTPGEDAVLVPAATLAAEKPVFVMVPMRDGVRLATDVYLPQGDGPWPTVLIRTTYSRQDGMAGLADILNVAGYAVVVQDTRGRFDSKGTDSGFFDATQDGQTTLEWIATQPWCDGRIGTWGPSALGIVQYMLAPGAPQALRCQTVLIATPDLYHAGSQGGVARQALIEGWLSWQGSEFLIEEWLSHPLEDDYWDAADISGRYSEVHVPALHIGGWYDIFTQGTLDAFVGYQEQGGAGAAGRQHLVMGPWTHFGLGGLEQGELVYPDNAGMDPLELMQLTLDWYKACLLGQEGRADDWPPVRYYVMGDVDDPEAPGNVWREADAWPPPATDLSLYLRAEGRLDGMPPAAGEGSDTFVYDPADPSPTVCGANLTLPAGPCDQREVEARDDVLIFSTPPLERPLEVTGRVRARLWLVSDAPDTDLAVRLTDVYPDGRSMLVTDGILRARFRGLDFTREELMTPGTPYELEIDLGSTSIAFNAGHSIRIIISSSNAPRFDVNPNTGAPLHANDGIRIANNTILHDAEHPSALLLPVVE